MTASSSSESSFQLLLLTPMMPRMKKKIQVILTEIVSEKSVSGHCPTAVVSAVELIAFRDGGFGIKSVYRSALVRRPVASS